MEIFKVDKFNMSGNDRTIYFMRDVFGMIVRVVCAVSGRTGKISVFIIEQLAPEQIETEIGIRRIGVHTFVTSDRPAFRQVERNAESAA